jgi:hypothetical protein
MRANEITSDAVAESAKPAANGAPKLLFDVRESGAILSMSPVSVRKLIRQRRIRRVENFRKILIPLSELQKFAA